MQSLFKSDFYFFSISSGSCGNSYFLGTTGYGILIDAGVGIRTIIKRLRQYDISLNSISAVLVTHDHLDHIKSVGILGEKYSIPIYATSKVHNAISKSRFITNNINESKRIIDKGVNFRINDFNITPFNVPHDSVDNVGFYFEFNKDSLVLLTDVGSITDEIKYFSQKANHIVIEANYDEDMLMNGKYSYYLKHRIASNNGHLSNSDTANFIFENYNKNIRNILLCHLSGDNNTPEIAYDVINKSLIKRGVMVDVDVNLQVLRRNILSPKIFF